MLQIRGHLTSVDVRNVVCFTRPPGRNLARVDDTGPQGWSSSMHSGPGALRPQALQRTAFARPAFQWVAAGGTASSLSWVTRHPPDQTRAWNPLKNRPATHAVPDRELD